MDSLPDGKVFDITNRKSCAGTKVKMAQAVKNFGNCENDDYKHVLLFLQSYKRTFL